MPERPANDPAPRITGHVRRRVVRPSYPTPEASTVVIFGASGDLAARELVPALYALAAQDLLPSCFAVVGVARRDWDEDEFRRRMRRAVEEHARLTPGREEAWARLAKSMFYLRASEARGGYGPLREVLDRVDGACGTEGNRLFYLATPPGAYAGIVKALGEAGLARSARGWARLVVEKPFGHDLASARGLNREILAVFEEPQVYRIDHYLGKETVQNILAFRFGNSIFEPLWNRRYVDHVQITVAETVGVGGRGGYYDRAGALRDMVQNHLLQLVALTALEPPAAFDAESIRDEKVKLLRSIAPLEGEPALAATVRGQYAGGVVDGQALPAYREEPDVAADSATETYVALRLTVDNWRWAGVPFYLRTGKALARRVTEVTIQYREPPLSLFEQAARERTADAGPLAPNRLSLRLQPDEGIALRFGLKPPGERMSLVPVDMDFGYREGFGVELPQAYERLLLDALRGDPTLFVRADEVDAAWALMTPILEAWAAAGPGALESYPAGSWGPKAAGELLARDGRRWATLDH
jgi:glucose-6-phosphate 1-dehydrogenase